MWWSAWASEHFSSMASPGANATTSGAVSCDFASDAQHFAEFRTRLSLRVANAWSSHSTEVVKQIARDKACHHATARAERRRVAGAASSEPADAFALLLAAFAARRRAQ